MRWRKIISEKPIYVVAGKNGTVRVSITNLPASWMFDSVERNQAGVHLSVPRSGVFAMDGTEISGPAPRSMDDLESKVEDGMLKVRYQYFRQTDSN